MLLTIKNIASPFLLTFLSDSKLDFNDLSIKKGILMLSDWMNHFRLLKPYKLTNIHYMKHLQNYQLWYCDNWLDMQFFKVLKAENFHATIPMSQFNLLKPDNVIFLKWEAWVFHSLWLLLLNMGFIDNYDIFLINW